MAKTCLILLPAILAAGCVLGPEYTKPDTALPATFRSQISASDTGSLADLPWWSVFRDECLQRLIKDAIANNNDLQIAVARVEQTRATLGEAQSYGKPQVGYQSTAGAEKSLVIWPDSSKGIVYGALSSAFNFAWELDVWGRIRHSNDAEKANLLAQEDVRRGVVLTLVSDLATGYFQLLDLDRELSITEESARVYQDTVKLFTLRFDAATDSRLPVERAQAAYLSSMANIQDLRRRIAEQENAISMLAGGYPREIERGISLTEQSVPDAPPGTTTALLQRRPDILQAEHKMISANAEIGVAVANFFPKVGLSSFAGVQGIDVNGGLNSLGIWNLALSAAGPIYSGGRLEEQYHQRQAFWDETVAQYKQKVFVAFQETSNALVAEQTLVPRRLALEGQVIALRKSSDLARTQYQTGQASYFEVLEVEQELFPAEAKLAQTQRDQLLAVVNLYRALGGGWNADATGVSQPVANSAG
jgi:multidrug efflux system outer membrane protein